MIILKNAPLHEGVINLKRGDFFIDGEIVFIQQVKSIITVLTKEDNLYTVHLKRETYSIFKIKRSKKQGNIHREIHFFLRNCAFFLYDD